MKPDLSQTGGSQPHTTLPLGARVWSVPDGRVGRVVTRIQGGLAYRVMLEGAYTACERCGGDLLALCADED